MATDIQSRCERSNLSASSPYGCADSGTPFVSGRRTPRYGF
ncbi:hypothetical protein T261_00768 [Streptomyces lydicus]|nr:hypothetical protein T261_00768 [Streptomyces lydicus]